MNRTILFLILLLAAACKDSEKEVGPYLTLEEEKLVLDHNTQTRMVEGMTNLNQVEFRFDQEGENWCKATYDAEKGKFIFVIQENKALEPRETVVKIGNANVGTQITIFQGGVAPYLLLTPEKVQVDAAGGSVETTASTNIEYEVSVKGGNWINLISEEEAADSRVKKFRIMRNTGAVARTGVVEFRQKGDTLKRTLTIVQEGNRYTAEMKVPFGKMGFIEPLENKNYAQKKASGIREWQNGETIIKFFVNVAGEPLPDDSLFMEVKGHAYEDARLEVKINDEKAGELSVKAGDFRLALPSFVPPSSNYQCISFQGMEGNKHYPDLDSMVIRYRPGLSLNYNTSDYGAPAVHLSYGQVNGSNIEWSLGEVMVRPEACRPDIYYMVSGFNGGYCGIQVSADFDLAAPRGNTFLFSVWSDYNTQNPSEIPDDYQPWTDEIRKASDMRDEGFGNEGSGVHANWFYKWKPEVIYKFLIRQEDLGTVRRNGKDYPDCKAYTCWVYVPEEGGWVFFVRYIRPNDTRGSLGVPGSFVENPSGTHSSSRYRGYYRHWIRYRGTSEWVALTHANFSTTGANSLHPRYDVGIGKEEILDENNYGGEFCYIFSGGFMVNTGKGGLKEELSFAGMPDVDLEHLPALELFDNLMEGDTPEGVEYADRSAWTATASSEESGGPYEDGYARFAIDNNTGTFWHTRYTGGAPGYPHWIQIDMQEEQLMNGFYIQPRGRDVTKEFEVQISSDNINWASLGQFVLANNGNVQKFILPEQKSVRYVKITSLNGYGNTPYTSISEIGIFRNR